MLPFFSASYDCRGVDFYFMDCLDHSQEIRRRDLPMDVVARTADVTTAPAQPSNVLLHIQSNLILCPVGEHTRSILCR